MIIELDKENIYQNRAYIRHDLNNIKELLDSKYQILIKLLSNTSDNENISNIENSLDEINILKNTLNKLTNKLDKISNLGKNAKSKKQRKELNFQKNLFNEDYSSFANKYNSFEKNFDVVLDNFVLYSKDENLQPNSNDNCDNYDNYDNNNNNIIDSSNTVNKNNSSDNINNDNALEQEPKQKLKQEPKSDFKKHIEELISDIDINYLYADDDCKIDKPYVVNKAEEKNIEDVVKDKAQKVKKCKDEKEENVKQTDTNSNKSSLLVKEAKNIESDFSLLKKQSNYAKEKESRIDKYLDEYKSKIKDDKNDENKLEQQKKINKLNKNKNLISCDLNNISWDDLEELQEDFPKTQDNTNIAYSKISLDEQKPDININDSSNEKSSSSGNSIIEDLYFEKQNEKIKEQKVEAIDFEQENTEHENLIKEDIQEKNVAKTINTTFSVDDYVKTTPLEDNKVLKISQIDNKVYLPYKAAKVKRLFKTYDYRDYEEVIEENYVVNLSKYSNPSISRFKEAYNLMRKKEHSSIFAALDLGLELTFNSYLNPAIITACNNLDELDIYLACLDENRLEDFNCFDIVYESFPYFLLHYFIY